MARRPSSGRRQEPPNLASLLMCDPHVLVAVEDHFRRALERRSLTDPVVVVEILDRPPKDFAEAMVQSEAEERCGEAIALGVQSRDWVAQRLLPCNRQASQAVGRGGLSPDLPLTLVIVSESGIHVSNLPFPIAKPVPPR